jgi:hypothetical protein
MVGEELWVSKDWPRSVTTDGGSSLLVIPSDQGEVEALRDALAQGRRVIVGLSEPDPSDRIAYLEHAVIVDGANVGLIGQDVLNERYSAILTAFVGGSANPFPDLDIGELLARWSDEAAGNAVADDAPIRQAWEDFVASDVLGFVDFGNVGSLKYWNAAPPECRSVSDAPREVTEDLEPIDVWFRVPEEWRRMQDGVLCLNSALASMGCTTLDAIEGFGYVNIDEGAIAPGSDLTASVARLTPNGPSWLDLVPLTTIGWRSLGADHAALVVLDPADAKGSFVELENGPPTRTTVETLSLDEVRELGESAAELTEPRAT